jgi:YCII-related domain
LTSVHSDAVRQILETGITPSTGGLMQYALLAYAPAEDTDRATRPIPGGITALLDRPEITGWARLHADESATTLRNDDGRMLLTDGPFIDSKEYLAGLFIIEAGNLDGALAIAEELLQETRPGTAIEVRPILDGRLRGA